MEQRLSDLEKRNRWLVVGWVLSMAMIWMSGWTPDSIKASGFQLVDESGKVRAELGFQEGEPVLLIRDENGVDRLVAFHHQEGTGIYINDASKTTRIGVAQFAHGGGGVALHGPESKGAAVLYFKDEGSLRFFDAEGNVTRLVKGKEQ